MASKAENLIIGLKCTVCKRITTNTTKNPKNTKDPLEIMKFCRFCKKHTIHKETKLKK